MGATIPKCMGSHAENKPLQMDLLRKLSKPAIHLPPRLSNDVNHLLPKPSNRVNYYLPILSNCEISRKIIKCRERYQIRKKYGRFIETTCLPDRHDYRSFTMIKVFNEDLLCLLDSGANVSVLGKGNLDFIARKKVSLEKCKTWVLTANGSKNEEKGTFYVVTNLPQLGYFGMDLWRAYGRAPQIFKSFFAR